MHNIKYSIILTCFVRNILIIINKMIVTIKIGKFIGKTENILRNVSLFITCAMLPTFLF